MKVATNRNKSIKINIILFVIFFLFAIVQLNDPDPIIWFSIYGIVALVCLVANYKKISKILLWILVIGLLIYSASYFHYFKDWFYIDHKEEIFGEMVYVKPYLEGTREFLGLLMAIGALVYQLKRPLK